MTITPDPLRPKFWSDATKAAAVEAIIDDVAEWADLPPDEIRADLIACFDRDGFIFAKNLDLHYWGDVNAALVEILDRAGFALSSAHETAEAAWVDLHQIKVPFAIGDFVLVRGIEARIVDIQHKTAKIIVQPVVSDGRDYGEKGGWIHSFEDATPVHPGEAA